MADEFGCLEDDFLLDFDPSVFTESPPALDMTRSWIGEIENRLMNDDNQNFLELDQQSVSDFIADLIVDYPTTVHSPIVQVSDLPTVGSNSDGKEAQGEIADEKKADPSIDSESDDDAVAKKRTRRLRNKDAAVRSRERKKEYVKDLETKSKYLERECMRLGRMLQCFVAENHSLRLCLQKGGNNASITRQESAVLLLESLLLGSLLWYLGDMICQFPQSQRKTQEPEKLVQSGQGSSIQLPSINITSNSRRCKGSRPRMKQQVLILVA